MEDPRDKRPFRAPDIAVEMSGKRDHSAPYCAYNPTADLGAGRGPNAAYIERVSKNNQTSTCKGKYMSVKTALAACATLAVLAFASVSALADDHAYTEGPVVNVARIRTVDGKFDEYMKWIDTVWKQEQELGKKAGDVLSYEVLSVQPRSLEDADLLLVVRYKNWAALDNGLAKQDAIAKQIEGSVTAANQAQADRAKIRTVLGSSTMQQLVLK